MKKTIKKSLFLAIVTILLGGCSIKYTMEEVPTADSDFLLSKEKFVEKFPLVEIGHPDHSNIPIGGLYYEDLVSKWGEPDSSLNDWKKLIPLYATLNFLTLNIVNGNYLGPLVVINGFLYLVSPDLITSTWSKGDYIVDAEFVDNVDFRNDYQLTRWVWKHKGEGEPRDWLSKKRSNYFYHISYGFGKSGYSDVRHTSQPITLAVTDFSLGYRFNVRDRSHINASIGYEYSGVLFYSEVNRLEQYPISVSFGRSYFDNMFSFNVGAQYFASPRVVEIEGAKEEVTFDYGTAGFAEIELNASKNSSIGFRYRIGELKGENNSTVNLNASMLVLTSYF